MAWNKELTKEDLVKAGLNPDDLAELKANGVKKADLDSLETKMTTSIMDSIKAQFTELETKLKPVQRTEDQNNNNNNSNNQVDEQSEFLSDPVGFTNKKVNQSLAYSAIQNTKIRMDIALDRARGSLKGFKNSELTKEIMDEWGQYKPEQFAMAKDFDPDKLLLKIHNMGIGNHHEEIQRDTDKKDGKYNMVASGNGGGGGGNNQNLGGDGKKAENELTPLELKQAARYGMKPEEWLAQKTEMEQEEQKVMAQA